MGDTRFRIKELHRIFSIDHDDYEMYLFKYDQVINGLNDSLVYHYSIKLKSANGLEYLSKLSGCNYKEYRETYFKNYSYNFQIPSEKTSKFIRLYTTGYSYFKNHIVDNQILELMFSIRSNEHYVSISNSIVRTDENKNFTDLIPIQWHYIPIEIIDSIKHSKRITIKNTNTIDCLYDGFEYFQLLYQYIKTDVTGIFNQTILFKYEYFQLIEYAKSKDGPISMFFACVSENDDDLDNSNTFSANNVQNEDDSETLNTFLEDNCENNAQDENEGIGANSNSACTEIDFLYDENCDNNVKDGNKDTGPEERSENIDDQELFYVFPFTRAINNCDIESLKQMDQLLSKDGIIFSNFESCKLIDKVKYPKGALKMKKVMLGYLNKFEINFNYQLTGENSTNKIIDLVNYLNSSGFKLFPLELRVKFINDISRLGLPIETINSLKIDFKEFLPLTTTLPLIFDLISNNITPNFIQMLLNNGFNPFTIVENGSIAIEPFFKEWENQYNQLYDSSYYKYNENSFKFENYPQSCLIQTDIGNYYQQRFSISKSFESSDNIFSMIKLLLQQVVDKSSSHFGVINPIEKLINYLFKRFIKVYQISTDKVQSTIEFIKSAWLSRAGYEFTLQHSLYHIIFYLSIKSHSYIQMLIGKQESFMINNGKQFYDNSNFNYEDHIGYYNNTNNSEIQDCFQLLKPNLFSFDFIFNFPYHQILDLIQTTIN